MKTILPRVLGTACTLLALSALADTKLITDGAPLRYLVPRDGSLGGSWRSPAFNDSTWPSGQNGIGYEVDPGAYNASVIADSRGDFSTAGQQGANSWINGYYNLSLDPDATYQATDFQPFPRSDGPWGADNFWDGGGWEWFNGDPPWDAIYAADVHPNGVNNGEEHWVIRRWHSTVNGPITVRFAVRKSNLNGSGVTGKAFKNGTEIYTKAISGTDGVGFDVYLNTTVQVGDVFDFALTPLGIGGDPGDGADGSIMTATILSGTIVPPPPPVVPGIVAHSVDDWSSTGAQGFNGWYYGFYNKTADADGTYNPNTDFNTTDPQWTFGGEWTLGPGDPPWDIIGQTTWHPNGDNNAEIHWVIRRWVSDEDGDFHAKIRFGKDNRNGGNGTTLHVLHNGTELLSRTVPFNEVGVDLIVSLPGVFVGDKIEFALDPLGTDGGFEDGADGSFINAQIVRGPPPQTAVADSVADWSTTGVQGANGWFYGFYNLTADPNGTYDPATEFNTTDPNWTFSGAWTLGPGDPPWDIIGQSDWHPNGDNNGHVDWVIRRWVSDVDGDLHAKVQFGKQNPNGSGTTLRVFHNGTQLFFRTIAGNDSAGIDVAIPLPGVFIGDKIEFALDSLGADGSRHDGADGSFIRVQILTGLPPVPPRPFVPGIADCFRTDIETAMKGVNPSVFLRIPFNVANPADIQTLKLKMKYNDGFVAYLNGNEIARRNTPTTIPGTVANSIADWSTNPTVTVNGWSYGYYDQSLDADGTYSGGADMTPFPVDGSSVLSPANYWDGNGYNWFMGDDPWTELYREGTHPEAPNGEAFNPADPGTHVHWTVRRWSATVDANLKARIRFRKTNVNGGDGVRVSLFHNSVQIYSRTIGGTDGIGRDDTVDLPDVFLGDNIDLLLGPGDNGNDGADGSAFSVVIFEGEPGIPWDGTATDSRTVAQTISPEVIDISSFISNLTPGQNLLAIQGFNRAVSDNEFVINAELLANRIPTAANDNVTATQNTPKTYPASALLGNDSDPDGDALLLVNVTPTYTTAQGGSVRLFGDTVRYIPPAGFTGSDAFNYTVTDLSGVPVRATVTVTVQANQCPTAAPSAVTVAQGATVNFQLQASDPDGGSLQYTVTQPPARGTLVVNNQTGAASYTSTDGCGADSLKFKVNDGQCDSTEATVSITINDITPPVVQCPANIVVQTTNPNGEPVTYVATVSDNCGIGSFSCAPPSGSTFPMGTTTVTCTAANAAGASSSCSFTVRVRSPNEDPSCVAKVLPEACSVTLGTPPKLYAIAPHGDYVCLALDGSGSTDPDGDPLTVTWTIDGTNVVTGSTVPACLDAGCHTITMTVSDGRGGQCQQSIDVCVITASEAVEQLIALVDGTDVERKNKRPLIVSLKASKAAFERDGLGVGAQMLVVFQHKVSAQIARQNPAQAALMTEAADRLLDVIECAIQTPRQDE